MKKIEVHLHSNTNCNLHCLHCYNQSVEDIFLKHSIPTANDIIDTIIYLCNNYDADIHLEGGEIFLYPELLKKMDVLPDDYLKKITITTNGTILIQDETILHMLKRIAALRISVESADATIHKLIRGCELSKIIINAKKYQEYDIPLWIRMTLHKLNYQNFIHRNILKLYKMGFPRFQVYEFQNVGRGSKHQSMLALDNSLLNLIFELYNTSLDNITLKMMFAKGRIPEIIQMQQKLSVAEYKVETLSPEESISIHANGDVFACPWENRPEKVLFNWYNNREARQRIQTKKMLHICEHCSAIKITTRS